MGFFDFLPCFRKKSVENKRETSTAARAAWKLQLPVNKDGKRSGRMWMTTPRVFKPWFYGRLSGKHTTHIDGTPCATSPNSSGCRTELRQVKEWKKGHLTGKLKVTKMPEHGSVLQVCGSKTGCPVLMVVFLGKEGKFRGHVNDGPKSNRRQIAKFDTPNDFPVDREVNFKIDVYSKNIYLTLNSWSVKLPKPALDQTFHFKYGVYSKFPATVDWDNIKVS